MAELTEIQEIARYFSQTARNRLVFCQSFIDGLSFVDVGKKLAEALYKENLRSSVIAFTAEDYLSELLSKSESDPVIGQYIAIYNIGILFEPSLGFNLKSILDNASKNKTVIICSECLVESDKLYFFQKVDNDYVDLEGLTYLVIK